MNNNQGRRRTRRVRQQRKQKNTQISRILLTICMIALVAVVSIGGTIAWLTADTTPVTNTFTTAGISITLEETKNPNGEPNADGSAVTNWTAQLIPGKEYTKNPYVTVNRPATDVDIYLFVKFEAGDSLTYLDYTSKLDSTNGWTPLSNATDNNVWYRTVSATEQNPSYQLLKDDKVTVRDTVVKKGESGDGKVTMPNDKFTMKYTAYAIQTEGMNAEVDADGNETKSAAQVAWEKISQ